MGRGETTFAKSNCKLAVSPLISSRTGKRETRKPEGVVTYARLAGAGITNADKLCNIIPWLRHEDSVSQAGLDGRWQMALC